MLTSELNRVALLLICPPLPSELVLVNAVRGKPSSSADETSGPTTASANRFLGDEGLPCTSSNEKGDSGESRNRRDGDGGPEGISELDDQCGSSDGDEIDAVGSITGAVSTGTVLTPKSSQRMYK
mmetsp:Transcript_13188/g.37973  ORF Transcript_13188/g.37973 Transcript_13188/m.37973 type:complete len:125 (+) Transcript_13188:443-817(+)